MEATRSLRQPTLLPEHRRNWHFYGPDRAWGCALGGHMNPCVPVEHIGCTLWRRIGERIRARRIQQGFTNEQLAEELGVDRHAFDAYEAGEEQAPARVLTQIAELLEISVLWFFQDITFEE